MNSSNKLVPSPETVAKDYNSKQLRSIPKDGKYVGSLDEYNLLEYLEATTGNVWCLLEGGSWRPFKSISEAKEHLCRHGFLSDGKNYFYSNISYIDKDPLEDDDDPKSRKGVYFSYTTFGEFVKTYFPDAIDEEEMEKVLNLI